MQISSRKMDVITNIRNDEENWKNNDSKEIVSLTDEVANDAEDSSSISTSYQQDVETEKDFNRLLTEKNIYIKEILADLQIADEENKILRRKTSDLKENLSDATLQIQNFENVIKNLKSQNSNYAEQIEKLKNINMQQEQRILDLNKINKNHEIQTENFVKEMDKKLNEWKSILHVKETQIAYLNQEMLKFKNKIVTQEQKEPNFIEQMVENRDKQIIELQNKLSEATMDIVNSTKKIESLKTELASFESSTLKSPLREIRDDSNVMETMKCDLEKFIKKSEDLETSLRMKEFEVVDTLSKINYVEGGKSEFKDLIQNNKKIIKQLSVRDKQIVNLVSENNNFKHLIEQLKTENVLMRKKLNIAPDETISNDNIIYKYSKLKKQLIALNKRFSSLDEEKILLQIRLRQKEKVIKKLNEYLISIGIVIPENFLSVLLFESDSFQQVFEENNNIELKNVPEKEKIEVESIQRAEVTSVNNDEYVLMKENYQHVIDENEGLRKCLHEILNVVRDKVNESNVEINLPTVESLLNILDSRHVAGWYHPAMRMLMELNYEKGRQNILQDMLKDARSEISTMLNLLNQEREKNIHLEQKLNHNEKVNQIQDKDEVDQDVSRQETNWYSYVKNNNKTYESVLHDSLKHFHEKFDMFHDNMMEISNQNHEDKEKWSSMEEKYKNEIENLTLLLESMKIRLDGVERLKCNNSIEEANNTDLQRNSKEDLRADEKENVQTKTLKTNIDDVLYHFQNLNDDNASKFMSFVELYFSTLEREKYFERKLKYVEKNLDMFRNQKDSITSEFHEYKMNVLDSNKGYEIKIQKLLFDVVDLRDQLRNSIPLNYFIKQNDKYNDLLMKYRKFLNNLNKYEVDLQESVICDITLESEENLTVDNLKKHICYLQEKYNFLQDQQNLILHNIQTLESNDNEKTDCKTLDKKYEEVKNENIVLNSKILELEENINHLQQSRLTNDMELNILRHQIIDLQSSNDDKATIARLSSEILITHVHKINFQQKEETLTRNYEIIKEKCCKLEEIIQEKDVQYNRYINQTNIKIGFLYSVIESMKEQYQGAIPTFVLENLLNTKLELDFKIKDIDKRMRELDVLKNGLEEKAVTEDVKMTFEKTFSICGNEMQCQHYVEMKLNESKMQMNNSVLTTKLKKFEEENGDLIKKINMLSENLLMLTFGFNKKEVEEKQEEVKQPETPINEIKENVPVPKPRSSKIKNIDLIFEPKKTSSPKKTKTLVKETQTEVLKRNSVSSQTDFQIKETNEAKRTENKLKADYESLQMELKQSLELASKRAALILTLQTEKTEMEFSIKNLQKLLDEKDTLMKELSEKSMKIDDLKVNKKQTQMSELNEVLKNIKNIEHQKDLTIEQYKNLLNNEKAEHLKTNNLAQREISDMKVKMEILEEECDNLKKLFSTTTNQDSLDNHSKLLELEDKCFHLNRELENKHTSLISLKCECERWKNLAAERFSNMEILKRQLEEKHNDEMKSYKLEAHHWLMELTSSKDELGEIKTQLNEQRTSTIKQLTEKNSTIEKLNDTVNYLKRLVVNLQAAIFDRDPTFDMASFNELEEINFDMDNDEANSDSRQEIITAKSLHKNVINTNRTEITFERFQKEKHLLLKQNVTLRKHVKILSARERRLKLELFNMKPQVFQSGRNNINTKVNKILQEKEDEIRRLEKRIDSLESQLSDRKSPYLSENDIKTKHTILWSKLKRWQDTAEQWRQKFQNKCGEIEQLQRNYESSKNIIQNLEKEKRSMESKLSKQQKGYSPSTTDDKKENSLEMLLQDKERLENEVKSLKTKIEGNVTQASLLQKLESQQRKIAAFELAEKGKDNLVAEYENLLTENTILSKKNVKLENEIIEYQLKNQKQTDSSGTDEENDCCYRLKQQIEHLNSYVKLLKEENSQLIAKQIQKESSTMNSDEKAVTSHSKKNSDLERTVLMLRGIITRLQSENKRLTSTENNNKQSSDWKEHNKQMEEMKHETECLKEIIQEKDALLNRAKELLKKAVEKEKNLQKEILTLRSDQEK